MTHSESGQSARSAIVEVTFLLVLGFLGYGEKISRDVLGVILSSYASGRLGLGAGKLLERSRGDGGGGGGPASGSGSEPRMPAVRDRRYNAPIPREDRRGVLAYVVRLFRADPAAACAFLAILELVLVFTR